MKPLVKVEGLYKIFGRKPNSVLSDVKAGKSKKTILEETGHTVGLKDINLEIQQGEIFVIMGLSGSGKSTLIRHFNRIIEPTEGKIIVGETDVISLGKQALREFRRKKMAMVFQHFGLLPHQTVIDNVAFGLKVQGVPKGERLSLAKQWLADVGLAGYDNMYPKQLSGGQQQRVGLARALCTNAEILLMDEAFSALDPLIRSEMQDQLIDLQDKLQKTIIFITHDLDEALRLGDRIAILKDGELIQVGEPSEILLSPADDYVEAFVKDVNRARALTVDNVMKKPKCRITADTIGEALKQMQGFKENYAYLEVDNTYQGTILQKTLEKAVAGDVQAKDSIPTEFVEGEVFCSPSDLLEEIIPDTLENEFPLPVVDESGRLTGQVSRKTLANILGSENVDEAANS